MVETIFKKNAAWAAEQVRADPGYFERLAKVQRPEYLWIGCSDSRVPANQICGLAPGEIFVHRNIANLVHEGDRNCLSVLHYAIAVLNVRAIIVCGHYGCGGVQAAIGEPQPEVLQNWLRPLRDLAASNLNTLARVSSDSRRLDRLCELNVIHQVEVLQRLPVIREAWERGQNLTIHGVVYGLHDGRLHDLGCSVQGL
ncbi:MAG: carbonate dehydratase [Rhodospirillales bacterium]